MLSDFCSEIILEFKLIIPLKFFECIPSLVKHDRYLQNFLILF